MSAYLLRRFLLIIPTLVGITLLVFTITRLVPGGPIDRYMMNSMAQASEQGAGGRLLQFQRNTLSDEQLLELENYYGLNQSTIPAYFSWLSNLLKGDLGFSTRYSEPVWDVIKDRLPISIFYGVLTLLITYGVCIPLGIAKAIHHNSGFDNVSSALVFIGNAIPGYVLGIALLGAFAFHWEWFPLGEIVSDDFDGLSTADKILDVLHHAVLPLITYVVGCFALTTFIMKNALMDNMAADYVRTAVAKGLPYRQAIFRHALRNSLIPMATSFGSSLGLIISGSFLIETIFNINGIGLLGFESLLDRDYPVVMGILVISSLISLLGNIISDICVALIDPRVKFGEAR